MVITDNSCSFHRKSSHLDLRNAQSHEKVIKRQKPMSVERNRSFPYISFLRAEEVFKLAYIQLKFSDPFSLFKVQHT